MAWLGFGYARWDQHIRVRARVGVSTVGVSFVGVRASAQKCKASFYVLNMILMKKRHFQVLGT